MKAKIFTYMIAILAFVGAIAIGVPVTVNAVEGESQRTNPATEPRVKTSDDTSQKDQRRSDAKDRLTDARLKACQAREKSITNIMKRATNRGEKHIAVFSKITERVQAFYLKKGKTLATYDQLVADVMAKKAAAQSAADSIASGEASFSCSADNPKGVISDFKTKLKVQIEAMKAYRTSVKDLIVGVKSVQGQEMSERGE